jgi:hypothetical protein
MATSKLIVNYYQEYFYLIRIFFIWFIWIFSATLFYTYRNGLGWGKGLYMAVNVGYSIGWGYPVEKDDAVIWYSIFHVLTGASAVALLKMQFLVQKLGIKMF